ncbi:pilus assembly protein PilP [Desulfobulbus propionicus]|nr:pilus assembly protein PilP [Desulfobulbus propionicus]
MIEKKENPRRFAVCLIGYALFLFGILPNCFGEDNPTNNFLSTKDNSYTYKVEGRMDPFKPFLSEKADVPAGFDPNEIIESTDELIGMQLFEPGQLKLVGVLISSTDELAMVEDQANKGYLLKVGTPIGKRGIVTKITPDQVFITETALTRSGKEMKTIITMSLNKEGEK